MPGSTSTGWTSTCFYNQQVYYNTAWLLDVAMVWVKNNTKVDDDNDSNNNKNSN